MIEIKSLTGISTIFGLIGAVFFIILRMQNSTSRTIITPELINALKNTNINSDDLKYLSPQKLRILLKSQTNISKELINKGIVNEINTKSFFLKITVICCFALSVIFFITSQYKRQNYPKNEINNDTISNSKTNDTSSFKNQDSSLQKQTKIEYLVTLIVNSNMQNAVILIDNKPAIIVQDNLTVKIVKVQQKEGIYHFVVKNEHDSCVLNKKINKNETFIINN